MTLIFMLTYILLLERRFICILTSMIITEDPLHLIPVYLCISSIQPMPLRLGKCDSYSQMIWCRKVIKIKRLIFHAELRLGSYLNKSLSNLICGIYS